LEATIKGSSEQFKKLLLSAIANAENNFGLDKTNLYVFNVTVGAGATLKRWMPKAYGRAGKILKRTSKITLTLEERVEGKGRKTKEEMEKEKQARMEAKKKVEKAEEKKRQADEKESGKEIVEKADKIKDIEKNQEKPVANVDGGKGWKGKIFRRKSM
jgi:large subunit ribosomal protein L22